MRYTEVTSPTHETFEAQCPYCGFWNVFNRATELDDVDRVDGVVRRCKSAVCRRQISLTNDLANSTHSRLLLEAGSCIAANRFGDAVAKMTTALEAFFAHALYELLAWKLLAASESDHRAGSRATAIAERLTKAIRDLSYRKLRDVFINVIVAGPPTSFDEADQIAGSLTSTRLVDIDIANVGNAETRRVLLLLKHSIVHVVRNRILHKTAYRPTEQETLKLLREVGDIIGTLELQLDVFEESFAI